MPRALRIEYPGAIYRVMNQGDRREPIFQEDLDHSLFLKTLGEACVKTDWQFNGIASFHAHPRRLRIRAKAERGK